MLKKLLFAIDKLFVRTPDSLVEHWEFSRPAEAPESFRHDLAAFIKNSDIAEFVVPENINLALSGRIINSKRGFNAGGKRSFLDIRRITRLNVGKKNGSHSHHDLLCAVNRKGELRFFFSDEYSYKMFDWD